MYCCSNAECGHVWVRTDERETVVLNECPKCGNRTFFKCDFRSWTGNDEQTEETHVSQYDVLAEKFKVIKSDAGSESVNLFGWKERMILYHDELWKLLVGNEPEKYKRDSPIK